VVSGGNNPETPVPNLIVFFVLLGWMVSIPELTDSSNGKKPPCCPHWRSVFSSVFKELMLSVYTPKGIDTDPLIRNECFLGASGNANGTPQPITTRVSHKLWEFFVVPGNR
jgi:hypothetical protein